MSRGSEFRHHTLENGLTVIAEVDPDAHTAGIGFFVKTGARDEAPELMGVSHFLEHMMFKGTDARTAEHVDRDFDDIGANHNAFTTAELTAFWAHCLPERLAEAEDVLSDIMRPALRDQDFNDERSVILEEIAMYEDHPFWVLYEQALERYYGPHPLGHRVLGTGDTVGQMPVDSMRAYFTERYSADNTTVAMAGRLDFDAMVERLNEHCGTWPNTGTQRQYPAHEPKRERFTIRKPRIARAYILMALPAPDITDDRRYAASILSQILGGGDGSRLHWALVETGQADEAIMQFDGRDGVGEYLAFASCSPGDEAQVTERIEQEMRSFADSLTEDDLLRVRSKVATGVTLHSELPAGRMKRLGQLWTYTGSYRTLEEELARINAVTLDDLRSLIDEYPLAPFVVGTLLPEEAQG